MTIAFKKGHIVPRWCGVKVRDRKAQHNIVFGCDVEVGNVAGIVTVKALTCGSIFVVNGPCRKMKNGTVKKSPVSIDSLSFVGALSAVTLR